MNNKQITLRDVVNRTTCIRCGRALRNEESKTVGMGKVCYMKYLSENNHKKLY